MALAPCAPLQKHTRHFFTTIMMMDMDEMDLLLWPGLDGVGEGSGEFLFGRKEWDMLNNSAPTKGTTVFSHDPHFFAEAVFPQFSSSSQPDYYATSSHLPTGEDAPGFLEFPLDQERLVFQGPNDCFATPTSYLDFSYNFDNNMFDAPAASHVKDTDALSWLDTLLFPQPVVPSTPTPIHPPLQPTDTRSSSSSTAVKSDDDEFMLAQLMRILDVPRSTPKQEHPGNSVTTGVSGKTHPQARQVLPQLLKPRLPDLITSSPLPQRKTRGRPRKAVEPIAMFPRSTSSRCAAPGKSKKVTPTKRQQNKVSASRYRVKKLQEEERMFAAHQELLLERDTLREEHLQLKNNLKLAVGLLERKVKKQL